MRNSMFVLVVCVTGFFAHAVTPQVKNVKAMQQYPWRNVYISYEVVGDVAANATKGMIPFLHVTAKNKTNGSVYATATSLPNVEPFLSGDTGHAEGLHRIVWDLEAQGVTLNSTDVIFTVAYRDEVYLVVDLSGGANASSYPMSYLYAVPSGGWTDVYKTSKLVLRRIAPGSFKMSGSYNVTLTKPFYMGIFEVTQRQYEFVLGSNPTKDPGPNNKWIGNNRPMAIISYNDICGSDSIIGKLRVRTGMNFDLPTEAQWEYACRAGTTSKYNNGGNSEDDLKLLGRYSGNISDGKGGYSQYTVVGSYQPNTWGLYDMHGNVSERCRDWYGNLSNGVTDPSGPSSGTYRVLRGGSWRSDVDSVTASSRGSCAPSYAYYNPGYSWAYTIDNCALYIGFRLAVTLSE